MLLTTVASIFIFLMVVLIHELGHFSVAKFVGIKVNEFSIGMGPKLFQKKKGETEYTLRLLPIGGYVKMEGEDESSNDPRSFNNSPVLSRIAVVVAGALMNFILAIIVLSIVSYGVGMPTTTIEDTQINTPAEQAGIEKGDMILSINGKKIENWEMIVESINNSDPESNIEMEIKRDEEIIDFSIKPIVKDDSTIIGIIPYAEKSIGSAISGGFEKTGMFLNLMFEFVGMIFKGQVSTNDLSGPVGVVREIDRAAQFGLYSVLNLLGFISINLGFFNLLPIPALDGSRIVFLLIELIRGKAIDPDKEGFIHFIGFILLISLMLIVTYKDIIRINLF